MWRIRWAVFCLWCAWQLRSGTAVEILLPPAGRDLKGIGAFLIRAWPIITVFGIAEYKWSWNGAKLSWLPVPSMVLLIHLQRAAALLPIVLPFMWHDTFNNFLCFSCAKYPPGKEIQKVSCNIPHFLPLNNLRYWKALMNKSNQQSLSVWEQPRGISWLANSASVQSSTRFSFTFSFSCHVTQAEWSAFNKCLWCFHCLLALGICWICMLKSQIEKEDTLKALFYPPNIIWKEEAPSEVWFMKPL